MKHKHETIWHYLSEKYGIPMHDAARLWIAEFYERQMFPQRVYKQGVER